MEIKVAEIKVPRWKMGTLREDLHKSVDMFISHDVLSYIREQSSFLSVTFKVYYSPRTWKQMYLVSEWEKILIHEMHRVGAKINA